MQTHHAGFLLQSNGVCVCVMLIFTDIHLLSVPDAGPLTRTHNSVLSLTPEKEPLARQRAARMAWPP